ASFIVSPRLCKARAVGWSSVMERRMVEAEDSALRVGCTRMAVRSQRRAAGGRGAVTKRRYRAGPVRTAKGATVTKPRNTRKARKKGSWPFLSSSASSVCSVVSLHFAVRDTGNCDRYQKAV